MDVLPVILFLCGVGFLFLGWRWQNTPDEETMTALKGLAYLKKEIERVQDQVLELEEKLVEVEGRENKLPEDRPQELLVKKSSPEVPQSEPKEFESRQFSLIKNTALDGLNSGEKLKRNTVTERNSQLLPKYREVLELAAGGEEIPDIAQRLLLSQDAVRMILRMQPNGGNNL